MATLQFTDPFFFNGHVGCFQLLALMNKAPVNILVHVFDGSSYSFLLDTPKSEVAGSWSHMFSFSRY